MFKTKNLIIGCVVIIFILGGVWLFSLNNNQSTGGIQTAEAGICSGNEPVTTLCNQNINNLTVPNDLTGYKLIEGGNVGSLTQSGTKATTTAAQLCDDGLVNITITNATGTNTTYLPTAADLVADCLTVNGQHKQVFLRNTGSATSTTLTANTGTTLNKSGDTGGTVAMAATSTAIVDFIRLSATSVEANVTYLIAN